MPNRDTRSRIRQLIFSLTFVAISAVHAQAQTSPASPPKPVHKTLKAKGEVNSNNVYVRSGPSLNHYTITKLQAGNRVTIVAEQGKWYEIAPPPGAFSLISGDYVDTHDGKAGVVNGNNVRVRAGSSLNQSKYTIQTKLSKGATVHILGRNPDGFLRINPPKGVTLWISADYVGVLPEELLRLEQEAGAAGAVKGQGQAKKAGDSKRSNGAANIDDAQDGSSERSEPRIARPITPALRVKLEVLDEATRTELAKPVLDRKLEPLLEGYREIASQEDNETAGQYAKKRIGQIESMMTVLDTVRRMRRLSDQASSRRRAFLESRANMQHVPPPQPASLDAKGILRVSALYPPGSIPCRYRLTESGAIGRTIGYVEIPADTAIEVATFLGRYIGVRASRKRLQDDGVDAVPIYLAAELVLLKPAVDVDDAGDE